MAPLCLVPVQNTAAWAGWAALLQCFCQRLSKEITLQCLCSAPQVNFPRQRPLEMRLKMEELCQPSINHTLNWLSIYTVHMAVLPTETSSPNSCSEEPGISTNEQLTGSFRMAEPTMPSLGPALQQSSHPQPCETAQADAEQAPEPYFYCWAAG